MKTIILYYSLGGTSKKKAEQIAERNENVVLCEVEEIKKRNIFTSFIPGCPHAMKRKASTIKPLNYELSDYDRIVIVCPVWANFPAPAFNAVIELLPAEKEVEIYMCSGSGGSQKSEQGTKDMVTGKNCILVGYHDVKANSV